MFSFLNKNKCVEWSTKNNVSKSDTIQVEIIDIIVDNYKKWITKSSVIISK